MSAIPVLRMPSGSLAPEPVESLPLYGCTGCGACTEAELLGLIRVLGLAPQKARALRGLGQMLVREHGGEVPRTFAELEELPGVGHKTASVVMSQAFGEAAAQDWVSGLERESAHGRSAVLARLEHGDLEVSQSWFRDSQQGILSADDPDGTITVDKSTFTRLGTCEGPGGCAHSIYIGHFRSVTVRHSRFDRGQGGVPFNPYSGSHYLRHARLGSWWERILALLGLAFAHRTQPWKIVLAMTLEAIFLSLLLLIPMFIIGMMFLRGSPHQGATI